MLGHNWDILEPRYYDESKRVIDEILRHVEQAIEGSNSSKIMLTRDIERIMLYEVAAGMHQQPTTEGFVLEFGTWAGVSTLTIVEGVIHRGDGLAVLSVDPYFFNIEEHTEKYLQARMLHQKYQDGKIFPHLMRVIWEDLRFLKVWNHPVRMVFIDTSHHYEHTQQEIQACLPHLVNDSWLIFHDYAKQYGVVPAVDEFVTKQTQWELKPYQLSKLGEYNWLCGIHMIRRIYND